MPTEFEQSVAQQQQQQQQQRQQELQQQHHEAQEADENQQYLEDITNDDKMDEKAMIATSATAATNGDVMSTSQTSSSSSSNGHGGMNGQNGASRKVSITSPDPTAYVAKARVTRPTPPPPSYNPMQFVQIKPCNLYQTAQQQLKKAEEVKKIKEIKKEEPEDWQNNLDNWKSSRRKRVEHIIDRVVEVKKLELEEHDRSRRKSKTFSEMIEERGERGVRAGRAKLVSLAVYNEDESNDLSDLGIGTSSASGKSSLSEDYDNNSVMSDNPELDKALHESGNHKASSTTREYISSPGYDTSSSTAPASSPDPCEYTYEGAIQDYKQRVSRASSASASAGLKLNGNGIGIGIKSTNPAGASASSTSKESTPERGALNGGVGGGPVETYPTRRGSKIEDRLMGFEVTSPSDCQEGVEKSKVDVPKIDISKRKEMFENREPKGHNGGGSDLPKPPKPHGGGGGVPKVTLRDRFKFDATPAGNSEAQASAKKEVKRLSGDVTSIRDRLQSLEQQNLVNGGREKQSGASKLVDMPVPPLKDRLSSLQNAATKEEAKKPPVALVDARQLEIMQNEEESAKQRIKKLGEGDVAKTAIVEKKPLLPIVESGADSLQPAAVAAPEPDRDDSGIHTSDDVESIEEHRAGDVADEARLKVEQELQLNAAIAALALEEKQLELAASAVNLIEEEFAELASTAAAPVVPPPSLPREQPPPPAAATAQSALVSATNEMEFSVSPTNILLNTQGSGNRCSGRSDSPANCSPVAAPNVAEVSGPASACSLHRKPSNEMIHHRNLLKMFKETFKNDVELDEAGEEEAAAVAAAENAAKSPPLSPAAQVRSVASAVAVPPPPPVRRYMSPYATPHSPTSTGHVHDSPAIATQVFHSSATPASPSPPAVPRSPSMIPRSIHPVGKPPMSPKAARVASKLPTLQSPLSSPLPARKADGQFSINGRVEIFNSKNMASKPPATPTTPTTPTKIPCLPPLLERPAVEAAAPSAGGKIVLPQQQPTTVTEALAISNRALPDVRAVPAQRGPIEARSPNANPVRPHQQRQPPTEVVMCAPPVTIVNPDELPKPNTVKAISSCFAQHNNSNNNSSIGAGKSTPPVPAPKPLPRSRIPQTPPQSPTPAKRNFPSAAPPAIAKQEPTPLGQELAVDDRTLSVISNASSISTDSMGRAAGPFETTVLVHSPPPEPTKRATWKPPASRELPLKVNADPLAPNDSLSPTIAVRSEMPALLICTPNESSLFKLASSAPPSPVPPTSPGVRPSDDDIALCAAFLANTRQQTVDEVPCSRMDVRELPPSKRPPCTAYGNISPTVAGVTNSSSSKPIVVMKSLAEPQRQLTVDEVPCDKVDVRGLPPHDQVPRTPFFEVSPTEVKRCDGWPQELGATPKSPPATANSSQARSPSKPNSPIVEARAAHSKALIETCERIIAEERLASNQMKSALPLATSPKTTPVLQRKSRIPKPIPCCTGSDSLTKADYESGTPVAVVSEPTTPQTPKGADEGLLIARLHVVETQIKVTTTTPPASPKVNHKAPPNAGKKTKNIFDFLKKNFGHHEEPAPEPVEICEAPAEAVPTGGATDSNTVRFEEILTVDNSKFYLPANDEAPPPLPLTPAPVNIEITKTITTDEILEEANCERALSQEINDMLDDELNKLSLESGSSDGEKLINEALELALEAIDKETTNAKMMNDDDTAPNGTDDVTTNNNANNTNNNKRNNNTKIMNNINKSRDAAADAANTTDEEKHLKSQLSRLDKVKDDEKAQNGEEDGGGDEVRRSGAEAVDDEDPSKNAELRIAQEPIYENITTASAANEIIPNTIINSQNHKQNNYDKLSEIKSQILVDPTTMHAVELNATATPIIDDSLMPQTTATIAPSTSTTTTTTTPAAAPFVDEATPSATAPLSGTGAEVEAPDAECQLDAEPYYQVPKAIEPYYDAPRHLRPIPLYENIDIFLDSTTIVTANGSAAFKLEPPKEKPPPPPVESPPSRSPLPYDDAESAVDNTDTWSSSDNTYETIASATTITMRRHHPLATPAGEALSPPIQQRMNSTKRIKKELRNKRSSFLGIESSTSLEDEIDSYLELTVAPPPDMAQLLQEERRLEKQLYLKAGLCDSSDTGESRDSGVSENHSRQSSEHYTVSSEDNDRDGHLDSPLPPSAPTSLTAELIYQNEALPLPLPLPVLSAAQTPLLQTVKGNCAESWTESATAAAAATKSLTEATATANAKMLSLEGKLREQEEVFRVETELLQLEQEELKRNRENLLLRENIARRELQHGAKMLMSANRHSLQELNGGGGAGGFQPAPMVVAHQQIYANVPNVHQQQQQQQYYQQVETDYRKSMSDLNEFSKRLQLPPTPPTKPMRAMHLGVGGSGGSSGGGHEEFAARQRHSLNSSQHFGGSLVKIAMPTAAPRGHIYANYLQQQQQQQSQLQAQQQHRHHHHQSAQNLCNQPQAPPAAQHSSSVHHGNMTRNTLHALSATPKPKYTDGWVQVQNRKSYDSANLANDPAWLSAYQQKRKSMPSDAFQANLNATQAAAYNNHWLVQEAEQRRIGDQQRRSMSSGNTPVHQHGAQNGNPKSPACLVTNGNGKPLPDSIIQSLTERVQSKGIGERKRFDNYNNNNNNLMEKNKSPLHATHYIQHQQQAHRHHSNDLATQVNNNNNNGTSSSSNASTATAASTASTASTTSPSQEKVLSVSGKKKCSHCGDELGRGAAMIIESLLLFYHINCFKCCVCHVQLGDGLNGTDVRVRNHKLHCQNCYSSDDGIKFSCV